MEKCLKHNYLVENVETFRDSRIGDQTYEKNKDKHEERESRELVIKVNFSFYIKEDTDTQGKPTSHTDTYFETLNMSNSKSMLVFFF